MHMERGRGLLREREFLMPNTQGDECSLWMSLISHWFPSLALSRHRAFALLGNAICICHSTFLSPWQLWEPGYSAVRCLWTSCTDFPRLVAPVCRLQSFKHNTAAGLLLVQEARWCKVLRAFCVLLDKYHVLTLACLPQLTSCLCVQLYLSLQKLSSAAIQSLDVLWSSSALCTLLW